MLNNPFICIILRPEIQQSVKTQSWWWIHDTLDNDDDDDQHPCDLQLKLLLRAPRCFSSEIERELLHLFFYDFNFRKNLWINTLYLETSSQRSLRASPRDCGKVLLFLSTILSIRPQRWKSHGSGALERRDWLLCVNDSHVVLAVKSYLFLGSCCTFWQISRGQSEISNPN